MGYGTINEMGRVLKQPVVVYFVVLSRRLPGVNGIRPAKLLTIKPVCGSDFEFGTFSVWSFNRPVSVNGERTRGCVLLQSFGITFSLLRS